MISWKQFKYHDTQQQLWKCDKRFVAVWAGRGSGKTELAKRKLILELPKIREWSDARYFYGAPTEAQAKRIAWDDFNSWIPSKWIANVNYSDLYIQTVFGSRLYVKGLDKPQRAEGVQWDGCVIDESCDIKPGTFDLNILPTLSWRNGWCWRIGVPKRQGVGAAEFKKFCFDARDGKIENAAGFTWPASEIIPKEMLEFAQRTMTLKDYNEQFNAQFQSAGGGVFYAFDGDYNVRPCPYRSERAIVVGSDFNVDPMAWVIGHRWADRMEWFDEIWLRDTNTAAALDVLYQRYRSHRAGFEFYGDATGSARKTSASASDYKQISNHEGFQKTGRSVHYPRSNPNVDDRHAACNAMLCNAKGERRMFIDPRCEHLIADLEARTYKPGTRIVDDTGDIGHITDAMGYAVHALFPIKLAALWPAGKVIATSGV